MKKILLTMLGVAGILCSTSCSDDSIVKDVEGDQTVQFTVALTDGSDASRAISDGTTVDKLYYEVYTNVNGTKRLTAIDAETAIEGKQATVSLALVKGQTYDIVFWASKEGVYDTDDLTSITVNEGSTNDETKDAFTAVKRLTVNGPIKETVYLYRPFAQINFGTKDMAAAEAAGAKLSQSKIKVTYAADTYNALEEEGVGEGKTVEFALGNIPNRDKEELVISETDSYEYLATAYVLFPGKVSDKVTTDLTLTVPTGLNKDVVIEVPAAPAQRNYRTNVLGNLLTNSAEFTVVVDPIYSGDYVENVDKTETVSTAEELQAAIDAAVEGNNVITFGANITATSIIVPQKEGINIVINGADHKFDGTFYLHGNARHTGTETLTFNGINFEHADGAIDFIDANSTKSAERYAHNVIVNNCTFTGNEETVGMRYRQCYNMTVKNSTFSNMHSLMWATGGDGVTIDGVTIENSKNGISFGTTNNVVVKNSNIVSVDDYGYALRSDASGAYKMEVSNNTLVADAPILLRKATGAYTLALDGNTLTTNAGYQIIVTASDYEEGKALTEPTGNYTLEGAEGYIIYPNAGAYHAASGLFYNGNDASWKSVFYLNNASDLVKAASYFTGQSHSSEANGVTFELKADIDLAGVNWTPWTVMWITLNGNGHKISNVNVAGGWRSGLFGYLGASKVNDLTIENVNIVGSQAGLFAGSVEGVTTTNVKIAGTNSVKYNVYSSESYTETWGGIGAVTGVVANSTINAEITGGATVELDYNGITSEATYVDALTGYLQSNKGTVVNNGTVTVVASSAAGLLAALQKGQSVVLTGNIALDGTRGNYLTLGSATDDVVVKAKEGVDVTISGVGHTGEHQVQGLFSKGKITFEGITFSVPSLASGWAMSSNINGTANVTFKNCKFVGVQCPVYQSGADAVVTIDDCVFDVSSCAIQAEVYSGDFKLGQDLKIRNSDFGKVADVLHIYDYDKDPSTQDIIDYLKANGNEFTGTCKQTCQ